MCKYSKLSPELITQENLKDFFLYCKRDKHLSNSFINQTLSALKLLRVDVLGLDWDNTIKIKRPRRNDPIPEIISKEEIDGILAVIENDKHKAIVALLYSSGVRIDEFIHLKLKDIDTNRMLVRVELGKGNKSRNTILSSRALAYLRKYYQKVIVKPLTYVFENPTTGRLYSKSSITKIIKRAVLKAGIKKTISAHSFRHSFATHLCEQGVNLKLIQRLMGHNSLKSTLLYLRLAKFDLDAVQSPLDIPC